MDPDRDNVGTTGETPPAGPPPATLGVKIFFAIVIIGFLAGGYGAMKSYLDQRSRQSSLEESGVTTDADVGSVTEITGRRIETYHEMNVTWDPEGPGISEFAVVTDCSGARWEPGIETVRIVYLPEDTDVVTLESCSGNFDVNVLPGIVGVVFLLIGLFLAWRSKGMWRE